MEEVKDRKKFDPTKFSNLGAVAYETQPEEIREERAASCDWQMESLKNISDELKDMNSRLAVSGNPPKDVMGQLI